MEFKIVKIVKPEEINIIIGQAHFIKTVEDIYEVLVSSVPTIKFGVAFCESSGPCLIRSDGNDEELIKLAEKNALELSCGHVFVILIKNAFPINILNQIKMIPEVCSIYCATANPIEVVVCETEQGRGILGVIDGLRSQGIETEKDKHDRYTFLRKIGYKK
ncbi:MAG: adenosine-specific kinase [candidate division WOR-3 bacterium]|nr:adenosine-specific kinase [candidate division WOR-3 bacterium]MCX7757463.1 adenosine-specific kinase [candidate division WOR-3 bacterium]MDW7988011.1 adenosine-specific kinase [candidate division WOR-3 bacterium]